MAVLLLSTASLVQAQEATKTDKKTEASQQVSPPSEVQTVVITSTGVRGGQRTVIDTPVPIDIVAASELTKTAQGSLDKALAFRVPSFSTVQTPVNDATSLLDPYEIRNMGPSRSLILINGKRKNSSALLYTQSSPGRGESGADISAIPQDAIKRIEVLRDGASAQYGSDAIAGVVNIILKDSPNGVSITGRTGVTEKGDGKMRAISLNHGISLGDRGFLNYTIDLSKSDLSSRSGIVSAKGEAGTFGADLVKDVQPFLAKYPDARNINGSPATKASKFLFNTRYEISDGVNLYANAAFIDKDVDSYANYRTPYWRTKNYGLFGSPYIGYVPTFLGNLKDSNATVGVALEIAGWASDFSVTVGSNKQKYRVTNSINRDMEDDYLAAVAAGKTPLPPHGQQAFDVGGTNFSHTVWNADFSKELSKGVNSYFGSEIRSEKYEIIAGDVASYTGAGPDSYAGNSPRDAGSFTRSNYGIYGGTIFDVSKELVVDATARYEKYSDFGNAIVGKLSGKYLVSDALTLRSSLSSGFRAPSLHQIYTNKKEYAFSGGTIQVRGLASNVSKEAEALQVPALKAEKSTNITLGLGFKPTRDTSMTLDYYHIDLKDRIVLGTTITPDQTNPNAELNKILAKVGVVGISFFSNSVDSTTSGIDYVLSHRNVKIDDAKLSFNLSGNYTLKNERLGAARNVPAVAAAKQSVLTDEIEALMFTSRPKFKTIIGVELDYRDVNVALNNTVFGPTTFHDGSNGIDDNLNMVFKTKTLTDLAINYQITKNITLAFNINNMFNVTPSWEFQTTKNKAAGQALLDDKSVDASGRTKREIQSDNITFDQRYSMVGFSGSHFSQLGRIYNLSLNYRF
ncbi:MAG: TonB-dependent receptor [Undibacterium sp.]|nr:TonB-dependent receptor [Undibacterium sp.]